MFHGTVLALKYKKPEIFDKMIRPNCIPFNFHETEIFNMISETLEGLIQTYPECAHLAEKTKKFLGQKKPFRDTFATLIHYDLTANNILNKFENSEVVKIAFIDFQAYDYKSLVSDIFLFIWFNCSIEFLRLNLDLMLIYYHENLLDTLKRFGIETADYEFKHFQEEIRLESEIEFSRTLAVCSMKYFRNKSNSYFKLKLDQLNPELNEFVLFMVTECQKRGWIC